MPLAVGIEIIKSELEEEMFLSDGASCIRDRSEAASSWNN
jgi:hypothetical protein